MRVQITLEDDDYAALKALADDEDRGVAQQARHLLRRALALPGVDAEYHPADRSWRIRTYSDPPFSHSSPNTALRDPQSLQGEHQPETHDATEGADPNAEDKVSQRDPLPG